eukprot:gnl/MRDRNA2_/MRDRNA2_83970_c1_seq2.p1 gnl/MRDRNA2_/MRDRNA2_83970_c1~~gnl/MRDRNA2_/MRDRNA2_83970_c1_seq2.p1  ORF type:complete len:122 (-),score=12.60 gnl/MRDRNA2_/MRDRNA2_83970_c1_seq2:325-690(-)
MVGEKAFTSKVSLKRHWRLMHGSVIYVCDLPSCPYFSNKRYGRPAPNCTVHTKNSITGRNKLELEDRTYKNSMSNFECEVPGCVYTGRRGFRTKKDLIRHRQWKHTVLESPNKKPAINIQK